MFTEQIIVLFLFFQSAFSLLKMDKEYSISLVFIMEPTPETFIKFLPNLHSYSIHINSINKFWKKDEHIFQNLASSVGLICQSYFKLMWVSC